MSGASSDSRGEVRAEVRDGLGWITVARPDKRNALTRSMWEALPRVVGALSSRDDLVGLVVTGAEGTFSAGADLGDVVAATASLDAARDYCRVVVGALVSVATAPLPTMALVAGAAAGGGAELAIACDLRVAEPGATFAFPFARLGVVPDRFTLERLTALVGTSAARRLVFTGAVIAGPRAEAIGLVDELAPEGGLAQAAAAWGAALRTGSRAARAGMKRALGGVETTATIDDLIAPMLESFASGAVEAQRRAP